MARIHGEEGRLGHVGAHRPGIVGRDAGRAELLQEDRLEIDEMEERAGDVHHRLAGADPLALDVALVDLDRGVARRGRFLEPLQRQPRREHHRPAHEDGVGHAAVAELADHPLGAVEVVIGVAFDLAVVRMRHRPSPALRSDAPCSRAVKRPDAPAGDGQALGLELLGEQEGKLQRLAGVEPRIALRLVALVELVDRDVGRAADALGDFLAGHLEMHAAGMGALGAMHREERPSPRAGWCRSRASSCRSTAVTVLPCMGSHDHTTDLPARFTARTSGGSFVGDLVGAHAAR